MNVQMLSIFLLFYMRPENNVFWPTGWVGVRKNQFLSPIISPSHSDLLNSRALPRKNFPGFPVYFFWSSFHICRQCSPLLIKYVSFANMFFYRNYDNAQGILQYTVEAAWAHKNSRGCFHFKLREDNFLHKGWAERRVMVVGRFGTLLYKKPNYKGDTG